MQEQAEVSHLVALGGEPGHVTAGEDCVEQHEPFDCTRDRHGSPKPIVRLVDRLVQRMVLQMENSGAGMGARVGGGVSIQDEAGGEIAGLSAVAECGQRRNSDGPYRPLSAASRSQGTRTDDR